MTSIGIVDDNLLQLEQLRQLAGRAGFTDIRAHADPRQALSAFQALPPSPLASGTTLFSAAPTARMQAWGGLTMAANCLTP